jgi:hypothetical protein
MLNLVKVVLPARTVAKISGRVVRLISVPVKYLFTSRTRTKKGAGY